MFNKNKQIELNKIIANDFRRLNQVLSDHGINLAPFLAEENLELSAIANHQQPLHASQFHNVVKHVLRSCDIPGLGLKTGMLLELTDYGILGYALLSSKNLTKATEIGSKYRIMTSELIDLSLHVQGNTAISTFKEALPLHWGQPYMIEESLSITWKLIKNLLQLSDNMKPIKIRLTFAKPSYSQLFNDMFQCPVIYEANANELYFPASWVDQPVPTADETAAKVCAQQCDIISNQMLNQGSVVDHVRRILLSSPMQSRFHINAMAEKLNLSPRTFRQRLYDAGTSYKEVINEVRMQMAIEYLQTTQFSVQEVAYLLGYDYSPNFFRAFKKSIGVTPSEYRNRLEQEYAVSHA